MNFCKDKVYAGVTDGLFISSGSEVVTELAARSGFDWLLIDLEHGLGGEQSALRQIEAAGRNGCAPLARIPALRAEYVKHLLDYGAAGIMAPMVGSRGEAEMLVSFLRYPPAGSRGVSSGCKAGGFGTEFKEYFRRADSEILGIAQIENAEGVEEAGAIAGVDGIDVLFIGHSDLSLQLGCFGEFGHPRMLEAEDKVLTACRKHGKVAGMLLKEGMDAESYREKGVRFFARGTDLGILRGALKKVKSGAAERSGMAQSGTLRF